nr:hypothetical protein [Tanacetum cinerariifolium]
LVFRFDDRLKLLEANFSEYRQTNPFAKAVSSISGIVHQYMNQQMNEAEATKYDEQDDAEGGGDDDDEEGESDEEDDNEETREEESFEPIPKTLKAVKMKVMQESSSVSLQFVTSMLNPTSDVGMETMATTIDQQIDLRRREAYTAYSNPRGFIYQNKDKKNRLMRIDELYKFSDGTLNDVYRTDLRCREAYTAYSNQRGFIYQNKDKKNRLMRIDELYKFSDGTLNDVRNALDDRLKGIRMQYLPTTIWRRGDKDRAAAMIQAIEKMLKTRRIMRSLEKFVGGRLYEGDFRMLQRI